MSNIDNILDTISKHGLDSLEKWELNYLKTYKDSLDIYPNEDLDIFIKAINIDNNILNCIMYDDNGEWYGKIYRINEDMSPVAWEFEKDGIEYEPDDIYEFSSFLEEILNKIIKL